MNVWITQIKWPFCSIQEDIRNHIIKVFLFHFLSLLFFFLVCSRSSSSSFSQTPAPSAQWCLRPLCASSWRWSVTIPSSWEELTGRMSLSRPLLCPAPHLHRPHPFSVRPFAKRSLQRA